MDAHRFDAIVKDVATGSATRRRALRLLVGAAAAGLGPLLGWGGVAASCGRVGDACAADGDCCAGARCASNGTCRCRSGRTDCGDGRCRDLRFDERNCGVCGNDLPAGLTCCSSGAVDLRNNEANCGACGRTCRQDQVCRQGRCVCPGDRVNCRGVCCPRGATCEEGVCSTCPGGQPRCGGVCCLAGARCEENRCVNGDLQPNDLCDQNRPGECASGVCGCGLPTGACVCRDPDCAGPNGDCTTRGLTGCCQGQCVLTNPPAEPATCQG